MKKSINYRFSFIFSSIIVAMIAIIVIFNLLFLEKYYIWKSINRMKKISTPIISEIKNSKPSLELFQTLEDNYNVRIFFINKIDLEFESSSLHKMYKKRVMGFLKNVNFNGIDDNTSLVKLVEGRNDKDKIIIFAKQITLDNIEYILVLNIPVVQIQDAASASSEFLFIIGIITIIFGSLVLYYTAKSITKPILILNRTAKSISELDFSVRPKIQTGDELEELNNSINTLSSELSSTINDLNSANLKLKIDIERERAIDKMRKEFISAISHEFKTPISIIEGYAEALRDGIIKNIDGQNYYANSIIDESNKLATLVSKLLLITKIESEFYTPLCSEISISDYLNESINNFEILGNSKSIKFEFNINSELYIKFPTEYLSQIIDNYLSNALIHCNENGIIKISLIEKDNDYIVFSVTNTGENIQNEHKDKIWDSFYRIDESRSRNTGGTGLGLSIVKKIAEKYNNSFGFKNLENEIEFYYIFKK